VVPGIVKLLYQRKIPKEKEKRSMGIRKTAGLA
jgi:hypothetical protein